MRGCRFGTHFYERSVRRWLSSELIEERLSVFQVGGVEALGEPVVDLGEHRVRFIPLALLREQPCEACGRAQLV
jgi:hypothetical protein